MKRKFALCAAALCLTMALSPAALAAEAAQVCYPTSVTRSEDGAEIRKYYDLGPEEDPAGIPRSDFEQDGFRYTLTDLLKQELPEHESRQHTETVSLESKSKDMESVLALLPQEKEFITEDGLSGILTLRLDTVQVEVSGYGSSTREVSATRSYPNLANQDTANIPKTIEDGGRTLTLQNITWQTDNTATTDGYALGDRFTAVATYTGIATSSYVKGYTVTADYTGTVSRIALNKTRYVAIFEGTALAPVEPEPQDSTPAQFNWAYVLAPLGVVFAAGGVIGGCLLYKRRPHPARLRHRQRRCPEHRDAPHAQPCPRLYARRGLCSQRDHRCGDHSRQRGIGAGQHLRVYRHILRCHLYRLYEGDQRSLLLRRPPGDPEDPGHRPERESLPRHGQRHPGQGRRPLRGHLHLGRERGLRRP